MEPSFVQVIAMGLCTVFIVLICLIIIIKIMGAVMTRFTPAQTPAPAQASAPVPAAAPAPAAANKQQMVAAIAAALAEDMGADVGHIKIHSIRKL